MTGLKAMPWTSALLLGLTGATAGVASGLLGIGGGTVVTPLLAIATPLSQVPKAPVVRLLTAGPGLWTPPSLADGHLVVSNTQLA